MSKNTRTVRAKHKINLEKSITVAFADEKAKLYADEYLKTIRSNWEKAEESIRGSILFLILSIVAFELLEKSAVQEVSIGPFKLGDLAFIQKFVPTLIAYYFYSIGNLNLMFGTFESIHTNILKITYPTIEKSNLDMFLPSPYLNIFGDTTFVPSDYRFHTVIEKLQKTIGKSIIYGALLFEIYAFYRLFAVFGLFDILNWISFFLSSTLIFMGLLFLGAEEL